MGTEAWEGAQKKWFVVTAKLLLSNCVKILFFIV